MDIKMANAQMFVLLALLGYLLGKGFLLMRRDWCLGEAGTDAV
jgi:hypothetical protein